MNSDAHTVDPPTEMPLKRLIDMVSRNTAKERQFLEQCDDNRHRHEAEIRKLRQQVYCQQVDLRAKDILLSDMNTRVDEHERIIDGLRQQLDEANQRIKLLEANKIENQQRVDATEKRYNELRSVCEMTADSLRRSAERNSISSGYEDCMTDEDNK